MNEFKQYLLDNYDHNTLADIANHGCSGGVVGMIYYYDTEALYLKFAHAIHEAINEYMGVTGERPLYVVEDDLDNFQSFANSVVWFAAEWFADQITGGEYVEVTT
jgi:hypothetical protein